MSGGETSRESAAHLAALPGGPTAEEVAKEPRHKMRVSPEHQKKWGRKFWVCDNCSFVTDIAEQVTEHQRRK
jgi:hypothetical protein